MKGRAPFVPTKAQRAVQCSRALVPSSGCVRVNGLRFMGLASGTEMRGWHKQG